MFILTIVIYTLIAFCFGGAAIIISFKPAIINTTMMPFLNNFVAGNLSHRAILALSGLLAIFLWIKLLQIMIFKPSKERTISFEGKNGKVSVSLYALEDIVRKMVEEEKGDEISGIRPKIISRKNDLNVILTINLASNINIPQITFTLQDKIKEKLQKIIGAQWNIAVKIEVKKFLLRKDQSAQGKSESQIPQVPFREYE